MNVSSVTSATVTRSLTDLAALAASLTDLGGTPGAVSLNSFLKSFTSSLESASPLGNLVDSTV